MKKITLKSWRTGAVAGIALLLLAGFSGIKPCAAQAQSFAYTFTPIAFLDDPAPGGGVLTNDFEPNGLNSRGDMAFGADLSTGGEGVFLRHNGRIIELAHTDGAAPGGGSFDFGFLETVGLNDRGDVVFDFLLKPFTPPLGVNAGAYRYSHATHNVTPVVIPFITPAPTGGKFQGVLFQPTINNRGDAVFAGIVETANGVHVAGEDYIGLGIGIFRADARGHIAKVVAPGDAAPAGSTFDYAVEPWINDAGDIAFFAHVAGEESLIPGFPPQAEQISALTGLYVKNAARGRIRSIVHPGDPAPGGGHFRQAFHGVMNNQGDIAFEGDLTERPGANQHIGVFVYAGGIITSIARPGDPMPGGGKLVNASLVDANVHINSRQDVVFSAVVDTDVDGDGFADTGLFQWSHGQLRLIVRTGTIIPEVGTIDELAPPQLVFPPSPIATTTSGAIDNNWDKCCSQRRSPMAAVCCFWLHQHRPNGRNQQRTVHSTPQRWGGSARSVVSIHRCGKSVPPAASSISSLRKQITRISHPQEFAKLQSPAHLEELH